MTAPGASVESPEPRFGVGLEDPNENDFRNAVLLVDPRRKEFLANLEVGLANSYAVLYARAERWIGFARRSKARALAQAEAAAVAAEVGSAADGGEKVAEWARARARESPEVVKWDQLEHRWQTSVKWLDLNLVMSGSTRGKRAEQLADVLGGSRDPPSVGGTQVVVPQVYQPQQSSSRSFFRR